MLVNICIPTFNRLELTRRCIESLLKLTRLDGEFVVNVVDNASTDGTRVYLEDAAGRYPNLRLHLLGRNAGVAPAANLGWAALDAEYYLKLDNDILVLRPDWLQILVNLARHNPELGQIGHLYGDWGYALEPASLASGDRFTASRMCNGGCALIPRRTHEKLGFWNEDYGLYGFEDLDYSERCALGGFRTGYANISDAIEHLGYRAETRDQILEALKSRSVEEQGRAEKIFVLNRFLFSQGLRGLYVPRRYLPEYRNGRLLMRSNPEYLPLVKMQEELLELVSYESGPDGVRLNLPSLARISEKIADQGPR